MKVKSTRALLKKELLSKSDDRNITYIKCSIGGKPAKLVELTTDNVIRVEKLLRNDPRYPQFKFMDYDDWKDEDFEEMLSLINSEMDSNHGEKKIYKYRSTDYIIAFIVSKKEKQLDSKKYRYFINAILRKISAENNTLTAIAAINKITEDICTEFTPDELLECLKEPYTKKSYDDCEYKLIKCISKKACGKHNLSLATKFCHHLNLCIFLDTEYADLFSIYDKIVRKNLRYYYNYYVCKEVKNIDKRLLKGKYQYDPNDLKNLTDEEAGEFLLNIYRNYQKIIDEIISVTGISRNGFDHLVWYMTPR